MTFTPDSSVQPSQPATPPQGWYADPHGANAMRWWDGAQWTEHTNPAPAAQVSPQTTVTAQEPAFHAQVAGSTPTSQAGQQGGFLSTPQIATFDEPKRKRGGIVGSIVGFLVLAVVFAVVKVGLADIVSGIADRFSTGPERELAMTAGDDWTTVTVLNGAGSLAIDPSWEEASAYVDPVAISESMSAEAGFSVTVDGAWVTDSDADGYASILFVMSSDALPGATTPKIEVEGFIADTEEGESEATTTSAEAIRTPSGLSGYVAEFSYELYGWTYVDSVASVVDGDREVLVYFSQGTDTLPTGLSDVESVLSSLTISE